MPTDSGDLIVAGENSFLRLSNDGGETLSLRNSHWRVNWSPAGSGNALFMECEGQIGIYADNIAMARYLQAEIEKYLYEPFGDSSIQVTEARFRQRGDPRSYVTESVRTHQEDIRLTWYDFLPPFNFHAPAGTDGRPIGVRTTFFPAQSARATLNGEAATGTPWSVTRDGRDSTSCCLAWCETWVRPTT